MTPAHRKQLTTVKTLLGGKLRLYTQNQNPMLYARTFVQGRYKVTRTGETTLSNATRIAERWFYDLQHQIRAGAQLHEPTFGQLYRQFCDDETIRKQVSPGTYENYSKKWSVLSRFLDTVQVSAISTELLEQIRNTRAEETNRYGARLTANTLEKDMIFIRQVLAWGKSKHLTKTDVPAPPTRKGRFKVIKRGRPYLTLDEYHQVTKTANARAKDAEKRASQKRKGRPPNVEKAWELYSFILICVGAALRTGEAYSLRWKDCTLTTLRPPQEPAQEAVAIKVSGKHSQHGQREDGWILFGGVIGFHKLRARRPEAQPEDAVFQYDHEEGFRDLLQTLQLYHDPRTGMTRNTKSLRVTGFNIRLKKNPRISLNDLRTWGRTSVEKIEEFYDQLDKEFKVARVAGGNVKKQKRKRTQSTDKNGTRSDE